MHKSNPWMHSPQWNKKAMLLTAAYFRVSTPMQLQKQYLRLPKGYFQSKTENVNTTIEFCIFKLVWVPNFSLNWQFWFFRPNLPKKGVSCLKQKSENHHWILHIPINRGNKFQLKLTILISWTKFGQNEEFQSETNKVNITITFYIFKLV